MIGAALRHALAELERLPAVGWQPRTNKPTPYMDALADVQAAGATPAQSDELADMWGDVMVGNDPRGEVDHRGRLTAMLTGAAA